MKLFLELGSCVYGIDIQSCPTELLSHQNFKFHKSDLRGPGAPEQAVQGCLNAFAGRIHILLNVAGVMDEYNCVDSLDETTWDRVLSINLTVPALLSKHVVNIFRKQEGGSIINVSSKAGISGAAAGVAYTVTKHALVSSISDPWSTGETISYEPTGLTESVGWPD